jgi:type II secretory ATPase GspE/PulE/Tfp pilus assembly ATPase PilB-like protein
MLDKIIADAIARGASDIHFVPESKYVRLLDRVNQSRRIVTEMTAAEYKDVLALIKDRAAMDLSDNTKNQYGEFTLGEGNKRTNVCASIYVTEGGAEVAQLSFISEPFRMMVSTQKTDPALQTTSQRPKTTGFIEHGV